MTANPVCPKTGAPMHRGVRPLTLTYKGESITFEMPGWYCDECGGEHPHRQGYEGIRQEVESA